MREIKLRAWEKDSEEMFYPDTTNNNEYFFSGFVDGQLKVATSAYSDEKDYMIMQYTGLKDCNGQEIYEGDILKCHHNTLGHVFYLDGGFRLSSNECELDLENESTYDDLNNYLIQDNNLVVIGNVFDMPDWDF